MKLKPMADNVLLKAHEAPETTVSGIVLATTNKEKPVDLRSRGRRPRHQGRHR